MSARPRSTPAFTAADIKRAVRAVHSEGSSVAAVDFPPSGGFRLLLGEPVKFDVSAGSGANEWDDVLAT